ncbi:MAG TPA: acyl carrier protein [Puia sp.]|nr:acyl carrier protein [Puia sp.]
MSNITYAKSDIELRIKKIIIEKLGINDCEIPNDASFTNDLGIDSLDLYEVFMEIEKEFEIKIPDEEAEKLRTTGSLINYIKKQF